MFKGLNPNTSVTIKMAKKDLKIFINDIINFFDFYYFQRECISVHVGQAGCQIGNACWELYW
jgi:hypothetical protein